ncbi:MAG: sodium-dependent transporter [Arcobacter sp.]|nr:MAG: sodium-dependent transporter [Arcobacter sp.]
MKIARFSRMGFILAAAGSAVGLGNIWKFPYIAGENGGGAFVLIYLITVLAIGFSVMIAEMLIGYMGRLDSVGSFEKLAPQNKGTWKFAGFIGFTGILILTFYSVVIGWIFHYISVALVALPSSVEEAEQSFTQLLQADIGTQLFYHTLAFLSITLVVVKGIKSGIEKMNYILMPTLIIMLIGMFLYAMSLDAFSQALEFMFVPDWSKINSESLVVAVGHAFFTLSLGMASILTYSASLPKTVNLTKTSLIIVGLDTGIAIIAGLMLFTFLFQYGAEPSKGPGLVFISLPAVFYEMGSIGTLLAVIFFVGLAFAGLTSAVSLLEPMVQYLIDRYKYSRLKASFLAGNFFYIIGIFALLSNTQAYSELLTFGSRNLFDWIDFITASVLLPLGGLLISIFIGYVVPKEQVRAALHSSMTDMGFAIWYFFLRYIIPPALIIVMFNLLNVF